MKRLLDVTGKRQTDEWTVGRTDGQSGKETVVQTDIRTYRLGGQTDTQTDRQKEILYTV